ncbi:TIM barrel protein [Clostridium folliculivorans]|uniref:AP endonuclease n=1 Tax=Clostridium folliculivorans TaxID=2886038 RepID=A0A9W6DA84_9CLOT|nr:TIM barrel protein [Clostridium folliculivorans]GKU24408.1 AP endonuclease [Clostridium folliculivorans]GKU30504.1 AP endonuclease [Clostridium folliculivorans]
MDKLLFGISGLPIGNGSDKFNYASGISYIKSIGLDAMELLFVRSVNVTDTNKDIILKSKFDNDIYLSAHGSHYINLNADELEKQIQSMNRIINATEALSKVEGRSLIFHPGFYLKDSKEDTYKTIRDNLLKLPYRGVDYRVETTGKGTQFGTLEELVSLCKEVSSCKLCIDFSHIHARENGSLKRYDNFVRILEYVLDELGREALDDMHIHMGGINYGEKGEKNHLPLLESDFNYRDCLRALKDFNVKGCVILEGPFVEKDALLLKNTYVKL